MNRSMHSADRATHLKVVVVALVAGIVMAGFCVARFHSGTVFEQTAGVTKAGKTRGGNQLEHIGRSLRIA